MSWAERFTIGWEGIRRSWAVWPYVIVGIAIGAFIHGYVPRMRWRSWGRRVVERAAGGGDGVPMYSNAAGMVPVVEADRQGRPGHRAFMMAVVALSLPR